MYEPFCFGILKTEYRYTKYVISDGGVMSRTSHMRLYAKTSKERANKMLSDLHLANAVGDESQKWILTFSHSPSVIKPSQAMGTCKKCSASDAL